MNSNWIYRVAVFEKDIESFSSIESFSDEESNVKEENNVKNEEADFENIKVFEKKLKENNLNYKYISLKENIQSHIDYIISENKGKYKNPSSMRQDAPEYFSCSSLISYLYEGLYLPSVSVDKYIFTRDKAKNILNKSDLKFGDLIFINTGRKLKTGIYYRGLEYPDVEVSEGVDHLGMYIGGDKIIHSSSSLNRGTEIESMEDFLGRGKFIGYGRVADDIYEKYFCVYDNQNLGFKNKESLFQILNNIRVLKDIKDVNNIKDIRNIDFLNKENTKENSKENKKENHKVNNKEHKKVILDVPYHSQFIEVENNFWNIRSCGGSCILMCFDYFNKDKKTKSFSILNIMEEAFTNGGYDIQNGFVHDYAIKFFRKNNLQSHREEGLKSFDKIKSNLDNNGPVIVSIIKKTLEQKKFHLIVIVGYIEDEHKNLQKVIYHEPESTSIENGIFRECDINVFMESWRGKAIFVNK